jgi:membrane-associated phospholipid phosphatase
MVSKVDMKLMDILACNRPALRTRVCLSAVALSTALLLLLVPAIAATQTRDTTVVGGGDLLAVVGAGALLLGPALFLHADSVTCVPCDRSTVPSFDRWAIAPVRSGPAAVSDVLLLGIGVSSWINLANEGAAGRAGIVSSVESVLFAEGVSELLKRVVGRKRPVLYTPEGAAGAGDPQNQQSWPSGHAAGAAAMAASYWLTRNRISLGGKNDAHAWALAASAVGVAALRVAAAKHFPSDVLSGLILGVASAGLVHTVKF